MGICIVPVSRFYPLPPPPDRAETTVGKVGWERENLRDRTVGRTPVQYDAKHRISSRLAGAQGGGLPCCIVVLIDQRSPQ